MKEYQRFLVALAGTEQDRHLLEYARMVARLGLGREFRFVHVTAPARSPSAESVAALAASLGETVSKHFGEAASGVGTSFELLAGERVDALIDDATRHHSEVILLGHRKIRSGQRSLARRLAMISPASVWMVPEGAPVSLQAVLAPVDFSRHSADSLEIAAAIAEQAHADRCLALHVPFDRSLVRYPEHGETAEASAQATFNEFLKQVKTGAAPLTTRLEEGAFPSRTILRVAQEEGSDLLVMSTRGRSRAAAVLLGSISTQVMIETSIAILVVKHFGAAMGLLQILREPQFWNEPLPKTN